MLRYYHRLKLTFAITGKLNNGLTQLGLNLLLIAAIT